MSRWLVIAALVGTACGGGSTPGGGDGGTDAMPDPYRLVATIPVTPNRNLDVLFVIDDSTSMSDKQENLANNFPNFINVLNTLPGGLPDLHLGVVTTDMGTKGSETAPGPIIGQVGNGGCSGTGKSGNLQTTGAPVTGAFISDIKQTDGTRQTNYSGNLASVFGQMVRVGAGGCGFEQPLEAMKAALGNNPANAGFLRPDALLAVVFLTDEDDCSIRSSAMLGPESPELGPLQSFRCTRFGVTCSTGGATEAAMNTVGVKTGCKGSVGSPFITDVAPYRDFLVNLKGDARKVVTAAIMGTPEPFQVELRTSPGGGTATQAVAHSCTFQGAQTLEAADPAVRMKQFIDLFPNASTFSTICQPDLSDALFLSAQLVNLAIGSPCITVPLTDADPNTPGDQPDCIVEDVVGTSATPIPACGSATCWRLVTDAQSCPLADHQRLQIDRAGVPDPATVTKARCLVE
jgi:hypothetical protein